MRSVVMYHAKCGIPEVKRLHRSNSQGRITKVPVTNRLHADIVKGNDAVMQGNKPSGNRHYR